MSFSDRIADDRGFTSTADYPTVQRVTNSLGLRKASRDTRIAALKEWCRHNEPGRVMRAQMKALGVDIDRPAAAA